jgi:hypothetical protein
MKKTILLISLVLSACDPSPSASEIPQSRNAQATVTFEQKIDSSFLFQRHEHELPILPILQFGLGDLDGDGDLDALVAINGATGSQVWFNDGMGNFTISDQRLTRGGHGVALGDFDGDGDLDALISPTTFNQRALPSKIYFNDGSGIFSDSGQDLGDTDLGGYDVDLVDIENDGDWDIHIKYSPDINWLYINDGDGNFSLAREMFSGTLAWG